MDERAFITILEYLKKIPSIEESMGTGTYEDGNWWIKFHIDITNELAWNVVQELGFVINNLSISEKLPSKFYPVSPPPYMNGGPSEFLSWIIESEDKSFKPGTLMKWLEGRLPNPVDDLEQWNTDGE